MRRLAIARVEKDVTSFVTAAGRFDLEYLGAHVREHHGAARSGLVAGQIEDPYAVEYPRWCGGFVHVRSPFGDQP